jgi:hypothetical protein
MKKWFIPAVLTAIAVMETAVITLGAEPAPPTATADDVHANNTAVKARTEMRRLWLQHAALTHEYIVNATTGSNDTAALAKRVQQNADDLAGALGQYYSDGARAKLSTLFRAHATLFGDAITMAKTNEKDEMTSVQDKLELNGRETVAFLAFLNPNWDEATLRGEFEQHVNRENDELTARVQQDGPGDATAWNQAQEQIVEFADMLSAGIERQFPDRFAPN